MSNLIFDCSIPELDNYCTAADFQSLIRSKIELSDSTSCNDPYTEQLEYRTTDEFIQKLFENLDIDYEMIGEVDTSYAYAQILSSVFFNA